MISILLNGQTPSGKNAIIVTRSGMRFPSSRFKKWKEGAIKDIGEPKPLIYDNKKEYVKASFFVWHGDLRRRDAPGVIDAIFHVIEKVGIVRDDAHIKEVYYLTMPIDRKKPRVLVQLSVHPLAT